MNFVRSWLHTLEIICASGALKYPSQHNDIKRKRMEGRILTLSQLSLAHFPDTVNRRDITLNSTFNLVHRSPHNTLPRKDMRRNLGLESDNPNPGIFRTTIMHTITHITEPGLQSRRVVFLHDFRAGDEMGRAGDGSPGAADGVQEGHVDFRGMDREIHRFAG